MSLNFQTKEEVKNQVIFKSKQMNETVVSIRVLLVTIIKECGWHIIDIYSVNASVNKMYHIRKNKIQSRYLHNEKIGARNYLCQTI